MHVHAVQVYRAEKRLPAGCRGNRTVQDDISFCPPCRTLADEIGINDIFFARLTEPAWHTFFYAKFAFAGTKPAIATGSKFVTTVIRIASIRTRYYVK
jgi:hypothetical protein